MSETPRKFSVPKHAFKFPAEVVAAVKRHVRHAISRVAPERYRQEANYTAALLNQLEGTAYDGIHGSIVFQSTVFDDRGTGSAESLAGADHAITATISNGMTTVRKAILVQAKLGELSRLDRRDLIFLREQVLKMKRLVGAPKIMEILESNGQRFPRIVSANSFFAHKPYVPMDLPEYFVARVTTTLDGCTDRDVVAAVQDSALPQLNVIAKLRSKG